MSKLTAAHIDWLRERAQRPTSTVVVPTAALRDLLAALEDRGAGAELLALRPDALILVDAVDHLLEAHDCDKHGYEEWEAAKERVRARLSGQAASGEEKP